MCKVGDIILVKHYEDNGTQLNRHSFVIVSDEAGTLSGLDYDLVCNVMSSFKDPEQMRKKLSYPGNFPITHNDVVINGGGNSNSGYIKAEQLYFFNKEKIDFQVIGYLSKDVFEELLVFIEKLPADVDIVYVTDNL